MEQNIFCPRMSVLSTWSIHCSTFTFSETFTSSVEIACRISFVCLRRSIWWFEALWQWSLVNILQDCQGKQLDNVITYCLANLVEVIERSSVTENITWFCAISFTPETTKPPWNIMRPNSCRPFPVCIVLQRNAFQQARRSSWDTIFGKFWMIFSFHSRRWRFLFSHSRLNISWQFALSLELLLTCTRWVRVIKGLEKTFGDFAFFYERLLDVEILGL